MKRLALVCLFGTVLALSTPSERGAQEVSDFLAVGEMAPDFHLAAATRHGTLVDQVKLSDLRGETVVLAFFFKVMTGG